MRRLCSIEDSSFPSLPYPQEAYTSTPKRKAKAEAKKHTRWKLWFLWTHRTAGHAHTVYTVPVIIFPFFCPASVYAFIVLSPQEKMEGKKSWILETEPGQSLHQIKNRFYWELDFLIYFQKSWIFLANCAQCVKRLYLQFSEVRNQTELSCCKALHLNVYIKSNHYLFIHECITSA